MSENKDNKIFKVSDEDIEKAKEGEPADLKEKEKVSVIDEVLDWAESFVFAIFVVMFIFIFFFRVVVVDGESMNNTLDDKDRLVLSHINYTPKRQDIVVVNSYELGKTIIKRCIGVEGDKIKIDYNSNSVYVNGEKITNEHNKETMIDTGLFNQQYMTSNGVYEYEVPKNCIFVMGDNRNNSSDSRAATGFVDLENVLGHASFRIFPLKSFGSVD